MANVEIKIERWEQVLTLNTFFNINKKKGDKISADELNYDNFDIYNFIEFLKSDRWTEKTKIAVISRANALWYQIYPNNVMFPFEDVRKKYFDNIKNYESLILVLKDLSENDLNRLPNYVEKKQIALKNFQQSRFCVSNQFESLVLKNFYNIDKKQGANVTADELNNFDINYFLNFLASDSKKKTFYLSIARKIFHTFYKYKLFPIDVIKQEYNCKSDLEFLNRLSNERLNNNLNNDELKRKNDNISLGNNNPKRIRIDNNFGNNENPYIKSYINDLYSQNEIKRMLNIDALDLALPNINRGDKCALQTKDKIFLDNDKRCVYDKRLAEAFEKNNLYNKAKNDVVASTSKSKESKTIQNPVKNFNSGPYVASSSNNPLKINMRETDKRMEIEKNRMSIHYLLN